MQEKKIVKGMEHFSYIYREETRAETGQGKIRAPEDLAPNPVN